MGFKVLSSPAPNPRVDLLSTTASTVGEPVVGLSQVPPTHNHIVERARECARTMHLWTSTPITAIGMSAPQQFAFATSGASTDPRTHPRCRLVKGLLGD